jgi:Cu+-exporting ATPase
MSTAHGHHATHGAGHQPDSGPIDPVCGMKVKLDAPHRAKHAGHDYRFCSAGCRTKFLAEPARYMKPQPAPTPEPAAGVQYTCPMHPEIIRDKPNFNTVNTRLKSLFQYFFNLSEYQLA